MRDPALAPRICLCGPPSGGSLLAFELPPATRSHDDDERDEREFESTHESARRAAQKIREGKGGPPFSKGQTTRSRESLATQSRELSRRPPDITESALPVIKHDDGPDEPKDDDVKAEKIQPNFSGSWVLRRVDGDMDTFLKDNGIGDVARTGLAAISYGVGKMTNNITQNKEQIVITSWNPKSGTASVTMRLDGAPKDSVEPAGCRPVKITPRWHGDVMIIDAFSVEPPGVLPETRRYMCGASMCVENKTRNGLVVKRLFERTSP